MENELATARFDMVAIGASAGGIVPLGTLVNALPADFPAAVVIVQHLDPNRKSHLAQLLNRHSGIPVKEAAATERLLPGHAYTAPPGSHLLVTERHVALTWTPPVHFTRPAVDLLFGSVAETYEDRAIAIVLTGSGTDGALGIRVIKEHGGTTIAQDPVEASHRGMPEAAIKTECVDFVLSIAAIAPKLVQLVFDAGELVRGTPSPAR